MEISKYEKFEYSLFNELFLILRELCSTHIQSYHMHLLWHGIDVCAEIFNRKVNNNANLTFRQSRQFLLAWVAFLIDKINSMNYDFVAGLCDIRCYKMSEIKVDKDILDFNSIGPQILPPNRLRLRQKENIKLQLSTDFLKPIPIIPYEKITKQRFKQEKLLKENVILEERWKSFDKFKEIKYIKVFLELLLNNKKFLQYQKALEISKNILQYRYDLKISFDYIDDTILNMLIEKTTLVTRYLTLNLVEKNGKNKKVEFSKLSEEFLATKTKVI